MNNKHPEYMTTSKERLSYSGCLLFIASTSVLFLNGGITAG